MIPCECKRGEGNPGSASGGRPRADPLGRPLGQAIFRLVACVVLLGNVTYSNMNDDDPAEGVEVRGAFMPFEHHEG